MSEWRSGLGQDSHVFDEDKTRPLMLAGVHLPNCPGLAGNSDADVVLHALCNAISSITTRLFLGPHTDAMCARGITSSAEYVRAQLAQTPMEFASLAVSIEARRPRLLEWIAPMRASLAELCGIHQSRVGITATSGEGLSACGQGKGIFASVLISARRAINRPLVAFVSCPDQACAEHLASGMVKQRLVACVQRLPISSTYCWQGELRQDNEWLLIAKTSSASYTQLQTWLEQQHPYAMPELLVLPVEAGLPEYVRWMLNQSQQSDK